MDGPNPYSRFAGLLAILADPTVWQTFDGWALAQGFNPRKLRVTRLLNAFEPFLRERLNEESWEQIKAALYEPSPYLWMKWVEGPKDDVDPFAGWRGMPGATIRE